MIRRTGSFVAADDAGNSHKISIMTDFVSAEGPNGIGEIAGTKTFLTDAGLKVKRIKSGVYQIAGNSSLLRSSDRHAR